MCFLQSHYSPMSKQSYWNTDQEYGFNRLTCLIYSALVICYLNGIVGICMLFMKDYRSIAISKYSFCLVFTIAIIHEQKSGIRKVLMK